MTTPAPGTRESSRPSETRLPRTALASLAVASLVTMMTETLPAGLLPQLASGLHATAGTAGQAVSVYAFGSMAAALPLLSLTRRRPQRPVLVSAIAITGAATLVAAGAPNVATLLAARVVAGIAAGLLWALAAHYALAITPEGLKARALSIAMLGVPIGMAIGTPAGTFLGQYLGWRAMLALLGCAGLLTAGWARVVLPPLPGAASRPPTPGSTPSRRVLFVPPLLALYAAAFLFEVGHMTSYTYASQLAQRAGHLNPGVLLLVIGFGAVIGLMASGRLLDSSPTRLLIIDLAALTAALLLMRLIGDTPAGTLTAAALWGLALGPTTTLAQAVAAQLADSTADLAQGILVTVLNAGMATGAVTGGALLGSHAAVALPTLSAAILAVGGAASLLILHRTEPG